MNSTSDQLSLPLVVQLEPVARSFDRYVKVLGDVGRTEPAVLLLKSQQTAGRHKNGAGKRVGLPFGVAINSVWNHLPATMERRLLRRWHLRQTHELVRVQQTVSQLVRDEVAATRVILFQPTVRLGRRQNLDDVAVAVVLREPFRIFEINYIATKRNGLASPGRHRDVVETFEQPQRIYGRSRRELELLANVGGETLKSSVAVAAVRADS